MGWGRMLLMGDVGQQLDIGDLSSTVAGMRGMVEQNLADDEEQGKSIEQLKKENRELKLYLATVIHMLVSKGVLDQGEVQAIVQAIEQT